MNLLASIPSPSQGVWQLGPIPIRAYALCIIIGVVIAVWLSNRRWVARGGAPGTMSDIAVWAVPFGLVGARLYHVITDYQLYFGEGRDPLSALYIWKGGLGVWGAIAFGALGAWIACKRRGIPLAAITDAAAPGVVIAQAAGRFGNWFNQELFGKPTTLPWGLEIDAAHRPSGFETFETFHPTFLYEILWNVGVAALVIWADRRFKLGHGRAFALYVMAYTAGRAWIEYLRIDEVNHIFGLRLNVWTSILVFLGGLAYFLISARLRPGREDPATLNPQPEPDPSDESAEKPEDDVKPEEGENAEAGGDSDEKAETTEPPAEKAAEAPAEASSTTDAPPTHERK